MIFDFRNTTGCLNTLYDLYGIEPELIQTFVESRPDYIYLKEFEDFFDVSNLRECCNLVDSKIILTHITTTVDESKYLLKHGLMNLQSVLSCESPLKEFLERHLVSFDIGSCIMRYKGNSYSINRAEYKGYVGHNNIKAYLKEIARKVYADHQVTAFLSQESDTSYLGYVHRRPEILMNISNVIGYDLSIVWAKEAKSIAIEFLVSPFDLEPCSYELPNEYTEYLTEYRENIRCWLLEKALNVLWSEYAYKHLPENIVYVQYDKVIRSQDFLDIRLITG